MADHLIAGAQFPRAVPMGALYDRCIVEANVQFPVPTVPNNGAQVPRAVLAAMMAAQIAAFTALKLVLYTNIYAWGPNSVAGDLVEPTGSWYARKVAVPGAVGDGSGTALNYTCASLEWDYGASVSAPQDIIGWALFDVF